MATLIGAEPGLLIDIARLEAMALRSRTGAAAEMTWTIEDQVAWDTVLVSQTVAFAMRTVPHYAAWARSVPEEACRVDTLADLRKLPILERSALEVARANLLSREAPPTSIRQTSGTSSRRLTIFGCHDEVRAIAALHSIRRERSAEREITLRVMPPSRRLMSFGPQLGAEFVALYVPTGIADGFDYEDFLVQAIWGHYPLSGTAGRVTDLHVTPAFLFERLTDTLVARGIEPSSSWVRRVFLSGAPVTQRMRDLTRDVWGAELRTSYSCTEIRGGAGECALTPGVYHFGEAFAEVVDELGAACGVGEAGRLVLTSLCPFQLSMPLLRYDVGDLAVLQPRSCACSSHAQSIRLLGRRNQCINWRPVTGARDYLSSFAVERALGTIPAIYRNPYPIFQWSLDRTAAGGFELQFDVEVHHPETRDLSAIRDTIARALKQELHPVDAAVRAGTVDLTVTVCDRGQLRNPVRMGFKG